MTDRFWPRRIGWPSWHRVGKRVNAYNRMSPANRGLLQDSGAVEPYLRGAVTLTDVRRARRPAARPERYEQLTPASKLLLAQFGCTDLYRRGVVSLHDVRQGRRVRHRLKLPVLPIW